MTKAGGVSSLKPTAVVVVVTEAGLSGLSKRFDGGGTTKLALTGCAGVGRLRNFSGLVVWLTMTAFAAGL